MTDLSCSVSLGMDKQALEKVWLACMSILQMQELRVVPFLINMNEQQSEM